MGQKLTKQADGSYVSEAVDGVLNKAIAGVTHMFSGEDVFISPDINLMGQLATNVANVVLTSKFTRKRVERGDDAIFGVIF